MSNANKIARYITTIYSEQSYAANVFVAKPMAVAATFFFFIHTLIKLNYKKIIIKPLVWTNTFLSLSISIIVFSAF